MKCPFCSSDQIVVKNSRPTNSDTVIWRRRHCLKCKSLFTTKEKIDLSYITVEKKSGKKVRYSQARVFSGIYTALISGKKVDRGDCSQSAYDIIQDFEKDLVLNRIKEIKTEQILKKVAIYIKKENPGAMIRYLAYFKSKLSSLELLRYIKKLSV